MSKFNCFLEFVLQRQACCLFGSAILQVRFIPKRYIYWSCNAKWFSEFVYKKFSMKFKTEIFGNIIITNTYNIICHEMVFKAYYNSWTVHCHFGSSAKGEYCELQHSNSYVFVSSSDARHRLTSRFFHAGGMLLTGRSIDLGAFVCSIIWRGFFHRGFWRRGSALLPYAAQGVANLTPSFERLSPRPSGGLAPVRTFDRRWTVCIGDDEH